MSSLGHSRRARNAVTVKSFEASIDKPFEIRYNRRTKCLLSVQMFGCPIPLPSLPPDVLKTIESMIEDDAFEEAKAQAENLHEMKYNL